MECNVHEETETEPESKPEVKEMNDLTVAELNQIRDKIEAMSQFNQIEVLRILNHYTNTMLNENKYGVHINLSEIPTAVIHHLQDYILYVNTQETTLNQIEQQKENFKNTFFANAKDVIANENPTRPSRSQIASMMKLKQR